MKPYFFFIIYLASFNFIYSQNILVEHEALFKDNKIYNKDILFTGIVISYYGNNQLKNKYEVEEGISKGNFTTYWYDKNFNSNNYNDTSLIKLHRLNLDKNINSYNLKIKDSLTAAQISYNFFLKKLGGYKKMKRLLKKLKKGKINKKKKILLEEYDDLRLNEKLISNDLNNLKADYNYIYKLMEKEVAKPIYINKIKLSYTQINSIKEGRFISFYENGFVSSEGSYMNNSKIGNWIYYYENGNKKSEGNYDNDLLNGYWTYYYFDGKKRAEGVYFNGDENIVDKYEIPNTGRDSCWKIYDKNGQLLELATYKESVLDGTYQLFENGEIIEELYYKNNIKNGQAKYYSSGKISLIGNYLNGKKSGVFTEYDNKGLICRVFNYLNDSLDGNKVEYYENGNTKWQGTFKNNLLNGNVVEYYENGNAKMQGTFKNNLLNGNMVEYYENGNAKFQATLKNNLLNGNLVVYYENGNAKFQATLKNNLFNGKAKCFYSNGTPQLDFSFFNSKIAGLITMYHPNGKLQSKFNVDTTRQIKNLNEISTIDFKIIGNAYLYSEQGNLMNHFIYNNDGSYEAIISEGEKVSEKKNDKGNWSIPGNWSILQSIDKNRNHSQKISSNSQSGEVSASRKPYPCYHCNYEFQKHYIKNCSSVFKKEKRPGYQLCSNCKGSGYSTTNVNCPCGTWCYEKECYINSCIDGWIECSTCKGTGELY